MSLRNRLAFPRGLHAVPLLAAALVACSGAAEGGGTSGSQASGPTQPLYAYDPTAITVTGAENFYADLLHQIGGSNLKVYTFLSDPSADPHLYESNAGDARAVADSRLVIENGLGYDSFMEKLLRASPDPNRVVINVQKLIGTQEGANVHIWYDPTVMPRVAQAVAAALVELDPAHAPAYTSNLATFLGSLKPLNDEVAALKRRYAGVPVAFTEPVFAYMADAIGLSVKSPREFMKAVEEGNDPPSAAMAAEQDLITKHQVKALLYNNQAETKVTTKIKDLATRNGIPVVGVSETAPPRKTFQDWQLSQLRDLERALSK
jgi:zinc/manganese transport system substrate-binding protein